mmetsp:Transcript_19785/g.40873  ORF Transcript_19785/g.40873 Transcript_19785/m.40873 type:complete len:204 (-) Transcript_19785:680-1291(-)
MLFLSLESARGFLPFVLPLGVRFPLRGFGIPVAVLLLVLGFLFAFSPADGQLLGNAQFPPVPFQGLLHVLLQRRLDRGGGIEYHKGHGLFLDEIGRHDLRGRSIRKRPEQFGNVLFGNATAYVLNDQSLFGIVLVATLGGVGVPSTVLARTTSFGSTGVVGVVAGFGFVALVRIVLRSFFRILFGLAALVVVEILWLFRVILL